MENKNYITIRYCSVDDLRSYLRNLKVDSESKQRYLINDLKNAIEHEMLERNRVTIISMLESKARQVRKLSFLFILVALTSCGGHHVIVWDGKDIIGFYIFGILLLVLFVLWLINAIAGKINRR